jgi:CHAT domain-containing protein/tetratricopeptide (TPR) repeat protein
MRYQLVCGMIALALTGEGQTIRAQSEDKVQAVGKDGLTLEGTVAPESPRVKLIDAKGKSFQLPAKLFLVKLSAGKKYRVTLDSKDIDSVLIAQNGAGRQLAWNYHGGGGLNSLLTLDVLKDDNYKIYAASVKGAGNFTLKVREDGEIKVYEVGAGLNINGELGKVSAITYNVNLAAGKTYVIDMKSPNQKLDPFLRLLEASSKQLAEDDDGGEGLNARIIYKAEASAIFQVVATCLGKVRGPFTLTIREAKEGDRALTEEEQKKLGQFRTQANQLIAKGKLAESVAAFEKVLALEKAVRGNFHKEVVATLERLAGIHESREDFTEARKLRTEVIAIQTKVHGPSHWKLTDARLALANTDLLAKMDAPHRVLAAKAIQLNGKVVALYQAGKSAEALKVAQEALAIRKEVLGEKHPDYATSLNNLGGLYESQRNYAKAEPLVRQALEIRKEVLGEEHPHFAQILNNLGSLYNTQGNYAQAEPLVRQALEIRKALLGEKHPDYATSLNNLANLYNAQGNYAKAEPLYRQALQIERAALGEKHPDYARSLNRLAILYDLQANYAKAERLHRQALGIQKAVLGEKHPDYAQSLNNLAILYDLQANYVKAEPLYRQALEVRKKLLGEKHPDYAQSLNNLAAMYKSQRNYAKAEPLLREALAICKEVLGEKNPYYAQSLNNLGALYYDQGNYANAEPLNRQALLASLVTKAPVAIEDMQMDDLRIHPQTVKLLANYALVLHTTIGKGSSSKERRSCDRSLLLALMILDRVRADFRDAHESKTWLTAEEFNLFPFRIRVLQQLFALEQKTQDLEAAFWTAEQGTARTFLESLGKNRANLLAGVSPALQAEETQLLQDIRLLDLRIDKESARTLEYRNPDLIGELIVQRKGAETSLGKLIARIETQHPQYAGLKYPRPCKLEQARDCLKDDEMALLFVPGTEGSFLVLVEARPKPGDKANGLTIIELPGKATLAEHVASLTDIETLALPVRTRLLGRQAFDALLGPCKDRIKDKSLVIVPSGSLCFLPFELLVEEDGKYLVEKHRIRYAPSLTGLYFINLWKQKRANPEVPLFAVGDPVYGLAFQRLEHSGYEVAEIAKKLGAKDEFVLTRDKASKAEVKKASDANAMAKARYVHFATHGILGLDRGKQPALVLNQTGKDVEESFLQMDEITGLKLNADLVVLSACKSGQGRLHRGEGVTGLARAFLYAGSKGVVCSLWSVDDQETSNLMVDFYQQLQKGQSAPEALRAAQLAMIRAGKAPLYWAPFIVIGE